MALGAVFKLLVLALEVFSEKKYSLVGLEANLVILVINEKILLFLSLFRLRESDIFRAVFSHIENICWLDGCKERNGWQNKLRAVIFHIENII